jgi:Na+-translocating ferredoxin:NAD+ oxidoreductase subunit B
VTKQESAQKPRVALIEEPACIGCTLCIEACPVDAIVGVSHRMHTVIAAECTGCGWCLPPCPVDCIALVETGEPLTHDDRKKRAARYRQRHRARQARLEHERAKQTESVRVENAEQKKRAAIERAMLRARQRLQQRTTKTE